MQQLLTETKVQLRSLATIIENTASVIVNNPKKGNLNEQATILLIVGKQMRDLSDSCHLRIMEDRESQSS